VDLLLNLAALLSATFSKKQQILQLFGQTSTTSERLLSSPKALKTVCNTKKKQSHLLSDVVQMLS